MKIKYKGTEEDILKIFTHLPRYNDRKVRSISVNYDYIRIPLKDRFEKVYIGDTIAINDNEVKVIRNNN